MIITYMLIALMKISKNLIMTMIGRTMILMLIIMEMPQYVTLKDLFVVWDNNALTSGIQTRT